MWLNRIGRLAMHALLVQLGVVFSMTGRRFAVHAVLVQTCLMVALVTRRASHEDLL
jgi:hypothetical protein